MTAVVAVVVLCHQLMCAYGGPSVAERTAHRQAGGRLAVGQSTDSVSLPVRHEHGIALHQSIDPYDDRPATLGRRWPWSARATGQQRATRAARLRRRETSSSRPSPAAADADADGPMDVRRGLRLVDEVGRRPSADQCASRGPVFTLGRGFPTDWLAPFAGQTSRALDTANVLNDIFRAWDTRPTSLYNQAFYYSIVGSLLAAGDRSLVGATIAFDRDQYLFYPAAGAGDGPTAGTFAPFVSRSPQRSVNLAKVTKDKYTANGTRGYEWFWRQRKTFSDVLWRQKDMCAEVDSHGVASSYGVVSSARTTRAQGLWTDVYWDCDRIHDWVVTYSVPFFGCNNFSQLFFKGVVALDFAVKMIDINQCDDQTNESNVFAGTHRCRNTTECVFVPGHGFTLGGYRCQCRPGYYFPPTSQTNSQTSTSSGVGYFDGYMLEEAFREKTSNQSFGYDIGYQCYPCPRGCGLSCRGDSPCFVTYDVMIRAISIGVVSFCMSLCLVLAIVIVRMRKTKVMKASMWIMMEIIILGSLLLYTTVIIQYFEPTDLLCILVPWFREVGFVIVYAAVVLKLYRILTEFQSRKAHRVDVRDKDLLKYIFTTVLIVVGFLSAWTAVNLDYMVEDGTTMVVERRLPDNGLTFVLCRQMWSEYIIELGEFLFLMYAIYLCYRTRSAPSDYMERRYLAIVIYNEAIISTITHIIRHFLQGHIHPDYIFLMYFTRCQLTVSTLLILIIGSKLWYTHHPPEDDHFRNRAYSSSDVQDNTLPESMKLHAGVNSNGDVDVAEINLSDMDPEEIRAELKRLYTQLQIYRTKTMRKDNPHISKRRGGRKQTHRRFSLQAFHHKHRHHHEHEHEHELSKTPEESTNSAEGVGYSIEESTCSVGELSERRTPTVTFKPGRKSFY